MLDTSHGDAPEADDGGLAERPLALLYLSGSAADIDSKTTRLLARLTRDVRIATAPTPQAARATIEKATNREHFQALFLSPTLGEQEVLHVVATLREARTPVAIVPVVTEAHQDLCASAVAAGADGVMSLVNGVLVAPNETLKCIWHSPHRLASQAATGVGRRAFGKLQAFFRGSRIEEPMPLHATNESERTREEQPWPLVERRQKDRRKDAVTKAELDGALEEAMASRNELREALETHSVARIEWESTRTELDAALAAAQKDLQDSVGHLTAERSAWAGRRHDLEARL